MTVSSLLFTLVFGCRTARTESESRGFGKALRFAITQSRDVNFDDYDPVADGLSAACKLLECVRAVMAESEIEGVPPRHEAFKRSVMPILKSIQDLLDKHD